MIDWKNGKFVNEFGIELMFENTLGLINNTIAVLDENSYQNWLRKDVTELAQCMVKLFE